MNKKLFNSVIVLVFVLTLAGMKAQNASASEDTKLAVTDLGVILPVPPSKTATLGSRGAHTSGFTKRTFVQKVGVTDPSIYLTNPDSSSTSGTISSIDLAYSGQVMAPLSGIVRVARECASPTKHQIIFIEGNNGSAVALVHMVLTTVAPNEEVTQGQVIGKTVPPPAVSQGCGAGTSSHVHMTVMKWVERNGRTEYTIQPIINTYVAQWIVKSTYLAGPRNAVQKGGKIEDIVKITSVHSNKIVEGRDTGIVRTMFFVAGNVKQTWSMIGAGDGYVYFRNRQYGKCMTIEGASMEDEAKVILATCGASDHQKFKRESVSGANALLAKHSGKALDIPTDWNVPNSGTGDGIQLQQWTPFYGTNQQWIISKP